MPQAKRDPWADAIDFTPAGSANAQSYDGGSDAYSNVVDFGAPQPATAPTAPPVAPSLGPVAAPGQPAPQPLPGLQPAETQVVYGDGAGKSGPNLQLSPEESDHLLHILSTDPIEKAAANARAYVRARGYNFQDNFDTVIDQRRKGQGVAGNMAYGKPGSLGDNAGYDGSGQDRAGLEGAGDALTLGASGKILSAIDATSTMLGLGGRGDPNQSWGKNYLGGLDQYEAQRDADRGIHPGMYATGAIAGSLALPTGIGTAAERAGYEAGKNALNLGASMEEARTVANIAARRAATMRGTAEGAGYGGAAGVLSADNVHDAVTGGVGGAIAGGTLGAVAPYLGGKMVGPTTAAPMRNAPDLAQLADKLGIIPTPATTGGVPALTVQTGLASLPGASSAVTAGVNREAGGLGDAASRMARTYGEPGTAASTGEALVSGAETYRDASKTQASNLYKARDEAFNGANAPVVLNNSGSFGRQFAAAFPSSEVLKKLVEHPIVAKILGVAGDGSTEVTLGEATDALSQVRGVVRNLSGKETGAILGRAKQLENALEKDVYDSGYAADQAAGRVPGTPGSAVKAQTDADAYYADRAATLKGPLGKAIKSSDDPSKVSAESVYTQLAADTALKGGNMERLRQTWFRLPDQTRGAFASTLLDDMGRPQASARTIGSRIMDFAGIKAGDEAQMSDGMAWSPETFLSSFNKMNPAARRVVFGKEGDQQIFDIARYASKLRQTGSVRNFSNTAKSALTATALYAVANAMTHGQFLQGGEDIAGMVGAYAGAKAFMATPKMRLWTASALKAAATLPPAKQMAAQKVLLGRLSGIARSEPSTAMAGQILDLQRRLSGLASSSPQVAPAKEPAKSTAVADWSDPKYDSEDYSAPPAASNQTAPQPAPQPDPNVDLNGPPASNDGSDGNYTDGTYR